MSRRYYLCPIVTETVNGRQRNRPKLSNMGLTQWSAVIPTAANGTPLFSWCLVVADGTQTTVLADATIVAVPDIDLRALWSTVPANVRTTFATRVQTLTGSALTTTASTTLGDVLNIIGSRIQAGFSVDRFGGIAGA